MRLRRFALFGALLALPSAAVPQGVFCTVGTACGAFPAWLGTSRDGMMHQAVLNTWCAVQQRVNSEHCVGTAVNDAALQINAAIDRIVASGSANPSVASGSRTWPASNH